MQNTDEPQHLVVGVPFRHIKLDPSRFSPRFGELRQHHVRTLTATLKGKGVEALDPLVCWQAEQGAPIYVVDGHHRHAAYLAAKWKDKVPCIVHRGGRGLHAAYRGNVENVKDRLVMSGAEKDNLAWRYLREADDARRAVEEGRASDEEQVVATRTRRAIACHAGVAMRRVDTMRAVYKQRVEQAAKADEADLFGNTLAPLSGSWWQDRKLITGETTRQWTDEELEDWRGRKVREMAAKIAAVIAGTIGRDAQQVAEAFALAVGERHVAAIAKAMHDARDDDDEDDDDEEAEEDTAGRAF